MAARDDSRVVLNWNNGAWSASNDNAKNLLGENYREGPGLSASGFSGDLQSFSDFFGDYYDKIAEITDKNNAWSASQADKQMQFQKDAAERAMQFNKDEAALNREWQERMSSTAHQREVKDLVAAGLNPVLAANGGASVTSGSAASGYAPSGAKGDTDTSGSSALVGLLGNMMSAATTLAGQTLSAQTNLAVADKYNAISKYLGELQASTQLTTANISAAASRFAAQTNADASKVAASIHAAAQKYGYDVSAMTQKEIAQFNASVNKELAQMGYQHDFDIKEAFPTNIYGAASSLVGQLTGENGLSGVVSSAKDIISGLFSGSDAGTFNKGYGGRR